MFEYISNATRICSFFAHSPLKDHLWPTYAQGGADPEVSLYVLQCAGQMDNVLPNNDLQHLVSSANRFSHWMDTLGQGLGTDVGGQN